MIFHFHEVYAFAEKFHLVVGFPFVCKELWHVLLKLYLKGRLIK